MKIINFKTKKHTDFNRLYDIYGKLIYKISLDILKDKQLSEDALNDTLVKVFKNLDKLDDYHSSRSKNFVSIIARNTAIDIYNKRLYLNTEPETVDEEKLSDDFNPENIVIKKETINELSKCINELDEKYRDVLLLRHAYSMSREEIGKALETSTETVKKRLQRGKAMAIERAKKKGLI